MAAGNSGDIKACYSISELAREFGITTRAIRFYEEKGLLDPTRSKGGRRVFSRTQRARLKLILRGKRFGLSLGEVSAIIGLADGRADKVEQTRKALNLAEKELPKLRQRIGELTSMADDLESLVNRWRSELGS